MTTAAIVVTGTLRATGFSTRITSMISSYSEAGLEIDLYHFRFPHEELANPAVLDRVARYVPLEMKSIRRADHLRLLPPVMAAVNQTFKAHSSQKTYDLVQAEMTNVWGAAKRISGHRRIIVFHDDDWMKYKRFASSAPDPAHWAIAQLSARRYKREQNRAMAEADMCWFVSKEEIQRMCGEELQEKCHLVPNGADDAFFEVPGPLKEQSDTIVFVGPPLYEANARSIEWFLQQCWPVILQNHPRSRLRLIGPGWDEWLGAPRDRVETPGFVDDLPAELGRATVVIAPLLVGGGTKIKMLEAMAAARPIVCTSVAAEGLPRTPGLTVADKPSGFAVGIGKWFDDQAAAEEAGRLNRAAVEEWRWRSVWSRALNKVLELPV